MINELTSEILFRCPCCQKLFCTDRRDVQHATLTLPATPPEKQTEFQCTDCGEDFFLSLQPTSSGLYKTEKRAAHEFVACAKCGFLKNKQNDECPSCGVIETKYNDIVKLESPRLFELNKKWNDVVRNVENDRAHQDFLNQAQVMSALNFAAQKYTDLQKIMGADPLIEKYLKQIELRLESALNSHLKSTRNKSSNIPQKALPSLKKSFLGIEYNLRNLFLLISFIGVLFFIVNAIRPLFPSLNGLVVATIALSLGLWSISKNQTKSF